MNIKSFTIIEIKKVLIKVMEKFQVKKKALCLIRHHHCQ